MAPRAVKRPYQPSISAYFHRTIPPPPPPPPPAVPPPPLLLSSSRWSRETIDEPDAEPPDSDTAGAGAGAASFSAVQSPLTHAVTRRPSPPATVQSSLLNVGMRVRKAVPEGYQTKGKALCQPKLGALSASAPAAPPPPETPAVGTASATGAGGEGRGEEGGEGGEGGVLSAMTSNHHDYYRGLVPYCGILKVGGHAIQPAPAEDDLPPLLFDDDWSVPSSSQQSNTAFVPTPGFSSTSEQSPSSTTASRKRPHDDADDEDECSPESRPLSPRSRPVGHTRMPNLDCIRQIAVPRSRRKPNLDLDDDGHDAGDGGGAPECEMLDADDFEEASFFRAADWGQGEDDGWMVEHSCYSG